MFNKLNQKIKASSLKKVDYLRSYGFNPKEFDKKQISRFKKYINKLNKKYDLSSPAKVSDEQFKIISHEISIEISRIRLNFKG